jgi:hypothetical protein
MKHSILKTILFGAVVGATLFFMPFFLMGLFITFSLFAFFMRRRMGHMHYGRHQFAFADKIRNMNEAEYQAMKEKMSIENCCRNNNSQNVNN